MMRCCTITASFLLVIGSLCLLPSAHGQSTNVTVRLSPETPTSSLAPREFPFQIEHAPMGRREYEDTQARERSLYRNAIAARACRQVRDRSEPTAAQNCIGLVVEQLFWSGKPEARNRIAELNGVSANNFYRSIVTHFCEQVFDEAKIKPNDIVAFRYRDRCNHVAIVVGNQEVLSKDGVESVYRFSRGKRNLKQIFHEQAAGTKGCDLIEYWRLKEPIKAEMVYSVEGKQGGSQNLDAIKIAWQPNPEYVKGQIEIPEGFQAILGRPIVGFNARRDARSGDFVDATAGFSDVCNQIVKRLFDPEAEDRRYRLHILYSQRDIPTRSQTTNAPTRYRIPIQIRSDKDTEIREPSTFVTPFSKN